MSIFQILYLEKNHHYLEFDKVGREPFDTLHLGVFSI